MSDINISAIYNEQNSIKCVMHKDIEVWAKKVVPILKLAVQRFTTDTWADPTTYTADSFIGFSVTGGAEEGSVMYSGITKLVPAGQVAEIVFGKWRGIDDGTATVGEIEFKGEFENIRPLTINTTKLVTAVYNGITSVAFWDKNIMTDYTAMFNQQKLLTTIIIPDGMIEIGDDMFCATGLTEFNIPQSVTRIGRGSYCFTAITGRIDIPPQINNIGASAFAITGVTDFTLTDDYKTIEENAFISSGWYNNQPNNSLCYINNWLVDKKGTPSVNIALPDSLVGIADGALNLTTTGYVTFKNNLKFIGERIFVSNRVSGYAAINNFGTVLNNAYFTTYANGKIIMQKDGQNIWFATGISGALEIPHGMKRLVKQMGFGGGWALSSNKSPDITSISIPETVELIDSSDYFEGLTKVASVYYNAVNANAENTWGLGLSRGSGVTTKIDIVIGNKVQVIPHSFLRSSILENTPINTLLFEQGSVCHTIGERAFNGEKADRLSLIGSLILPPSVKIIKKYAFSNVVGITNLSISEGIETIEDFAFGFSEGGLAYAGNLKSVIIPSTVTTVGENVFNYRNKMNIYLRSATITTELAKLSANQTVAQQHTLVSNYQEV